jgi:uncharacterized membrane protein
MGGAGTDRGLVTGAGIGSILPTVRVASKPAFAVVVGAIAFLAQDIVQRVTHITITNDEAIAGFAVVSYLAYWLIPSSLQDGGATVVPLPAVPPAPPGPAA